MQTITIMTFNLRVDVPADPFVWEQRKHWAAQMIEEQAPDLLGTQEANIPMLAWLTERFSPLYEVYGVNRIASEEWGEFSAVFVKRDKFSIVKKESFMLSETPEIIGSSGWDARCERICSWVELALANDTEPVWRFFNTHLDHVGRVARQEGLKLITARIKELNEERPLPFILTGDFNDVPENGLLNLIHEQLPMISCYDLLTEEEKQHSLTFHGYRGGTKGGPIDYILGSPDHPFLSTTIIRDQVEGGYPSDHYPVLSTLQF
ncbi:endonuclease/exonuclease/phosphatase family protein [Paenibacillus sp. J2TS4]|uniref:endonuclease/exonuclease/phosphatase family protein n=1 Tax=Paenibacillus sp. J2TS4 TaxID=2807194 RepID=UPI001AFDE83F|nr:endonuclease/exonuclease/phosphatase family protein [Paenibacillus sp. J2TS4]GIP34703.1 endonuclease [Paenibacillus sp. J2TS4]